MNRHTEVSRLRAYLERAHWPRVQMSLIVLLTGAVGFLASFSLLELAGLGHMALRYPLATVCAYLAFLGLLWTWARTRCHDAWQELDAPDFSSGPHPSAPNCGGSWQGGGGQSGGGGSSSGFESQASPMPLQTHSSHSQLSSKDSDSGFSLLDGADDFGWVLIAIAAALGAAIAASWVVWIAPGLMAELVLDVALAGGLYRRLRKIDSQHWLHTALRATAIPFLVVALMAGLAGYAGARYAPGADSFGDVVAAYQTRKSES
ncbi:hypothetical protein [Pseudomonas sp. CGJS7]|uniref:hypothetical protein n=1 Tax=Pseudomonas sp. CGJS7 TaxID=3109348 RepID=UPI003008ED34